jgi:hypothetical protein
MAKRLDENIWSISLYNGCEYEAERKMSIELTTKHFLLLSAVEDLLLFRPSDEILRSFMRKYRKAPITELTAKELDELELFFW